MKKLLVIASFLLVCGMANGQTFWDVTGNNFSGSITPILGSNSGTYPIVFRTGGINRAILTDVGDMGIGVTSPTAKLDVWSQIPLSATTGNYYGIKSELVDAGVFVPFFNKTAISGKSITYNPGYGRQIGVYGEAVDGNMNWGGHFYASGSTGGVLPVDYNFGISTGASGNPGNGNFGGDLVAAGSGGFNTGVAGSAGGNPSGDNIGVYGSANGNPGAQNIGVFGSATGTPAGALGNVGGFFQYGLSGNPANDWAVFSNGSSFSTGGWWPSDRNLKDNIKPINNIMDKIMLLKPSTYTYRHEEFKSMNLPAGEQAGLIAQELGTVFPELVRNVSKMTIGGYKDEADIVIPEFTAVNYIPLISILISGMQEQQKQIEGLQARLAALENPTENTPGTGSSNTGSDGFVLEQNIPNPFGNETKINYSLPQQTRSASLLVYDLTGKQISSFPLSAKESSITITSEKLAAGIYIYSVMADGKIMDSKRMVVAAKH